jgi:hypothetical protein
MLRVAFVFAFLSRREPSYSPPGRPRDFSRAFPAVANRRLAMGSADVCGCGRERGPAADVAADPEHDS